MSAASLVLLALAMATDAFAVAVCKGAALRRPRWREALRTGLIFGVIEALTPLAGWAIGQGAARYVSEWGKWIACVVLVALGLRMMVAGLRKREASQSHADQHGFWLLVVAALATSIDAFAVGIGLAFIDVNILYAALAIGMATFLLTAAGSMLGRALGAVVGRRAEVFGGLVLICLGLSSLIGSGQ